MFDADLPIKADMSARRRLSFAVWTSMLVLSGGITLTAAGGAGARVADAAVAPPAMTEYPLPTPGLAPLQVAVVNHQVVFTEAGAPALGVRRHQAPSSSAPA
ncbi:MAG TPA: hypothetical protein VE127_17605 [Solirubrobacteraceae bacterium]|nr:hypothetical protein [Solirubrobacteraceae bacterium]